MQWTHQINTLNNHRNTRNYSSVFLIKVSVNFQSDLIGHTKYKTWNRIIYWTSIQGNFSCHCLIVGIFCKRKTEYSIELQVKMMNQNRNRSFQFLNIRYFNFAAINCTNTSSIAIGKIYIIDNYLRVWNEIECFLY